MRTKWIGIAGIILLVTAATLNVVGPRYFPSAYWRSAGIGPRNGAMMSGGMLSGMRGGMVYGARGGMLNGMLGTQAQTDLAQPFDLRFLDQMIVHHQQGVLMTQHMIAGSDRAELRDLAQRIITAQQREIEQMRAWRGAWYGTTTVAPQETMLSQMSGVAMNREQMRGMMGGTPDVDQVFLDMMIPHHEAAIALAEQARTTAEHPEIKTLATTISTTQRAEIDEMQGYLQAWYGTTN